jgi:hypothetical protein
MVVSRNGDTPGEAILESEDAISSTLREQLDTAAGDSNPGNALDPIGPPEDEATVGAAFRPPSSHWGLKLRRPRGSGPGGAPLPRPPAPGNEQGYSRGEPRGEPQLGPPEEHFAMLGEPGSETRLRARVTAFWAIFLLVLFVYQVLGWALFQRASHRATQTERRLVTTQGRLADVRKQLDSLSFQSRNLTEESFALRSQLSQVQGDLQEAKSSIAGLQSAGAGRVKQGQRQAPNGRGVQVEITGFEGLIEVRNVQLRPLPGFSSLVGIAVNTSGRTISFAELGCTFLDSHGAVLANGMDSKENWAPGASWGFDCNEQVLAMAGILRVDDMT